jgi:catechol 2,3-dioxygenase-like lactoylglutathione lyase family enzyme
MTAISGFKPATRRSGQLGIHSIGEFVLTVPDLEQAQKFYGSFGLEAQANGDQLELHTQGDGYRWGRVTGGLRKAMHHVSFHCYEEDLPRFKATTEGQGIKLLDPPAGFDSNGIWLRDQDGMLVEIRVGVKTSPDEKDALEWIPTQPGIRNAPYRRHTEMVRPRRLAHILRFTPSVDRAIEFYSRVLGLRLSDRSGDLIAFLHGIHGSDHHLIAFAKSDAPGLHHVSWDVPSIDAVGQGAMQMAEAGYSQGWGLGRHVLGSNYFHYVRDPWGSFSEYSANIDYVPATIDWQGVDHPAEDSFFLWGPPPPDYFIQNYETGPL